jgi:hypothetical protein
MKNWLLFRKLGFALFTLCTASSFPIEERSGKSDQDDIQAARDWMNTKRQVTVREIGGSLSISGEVRAEFQATSESANGFAQRGAHATTKLPTNAYDVEVNLMLDYRADRTWAALKLEFDNDAGLFSSTHNKLRIEKAFLGGRIHDGALAAFDAELGRRPLSSVFDSKLAFAALSDGVLFRFDVSPESHGEFYLHAMAMHLDDRLNHYAYLAEIGWLDIWDTHLFLKYSIADWKTKHFADAITHYRFDFIVNQWLLGYKFLPGVMGKLTMPYIAFLCNTAPAKSVATGHKKANLAGYFGISLGELRKSRDWALDLNYQIVQAQAIPEFDFNGMGIGNAARSGLYTTALKGGGELVTTPKAAGGNTNYRGVAISLDFLITNNLNFQQQLTRSTSLDKRIGQHRSYTQYEIEFVYGF